MLTATCHCGAVRVQVPSRPERLTECTCSICRRYGTRWAYYRHAEVKLDAEPGATEAYQWGARELEFVRCRHCGCVMQWRGVEIRDDSRTGVNARNFPLAEVAGIPIELLDGAGDWKILGQLVVAPFER
jgi:hypothetical protein